MKKILALALAAVMVLGLFAGCGGDPDPTTTAPTSGNDTTQGTNPPETQTPENNTEYKIAMVTDYGDITDQSFNQTTYEASKAFCDANGVDFTYYKPAGESTAERVAMVDAAVADGFNVIVLPGYAFGETLVETASMYPDVKFIALDVAEGEGGFYAMENVYSAVYKEELSGYMAGYAAVMLGYKHLGFLGGMAVPAVQRFGYGYLQGVDAAAKDMGIVDEITVEYIYGNQFFGDADITAVMDTWYSEKGVEVVFASGGAIYTSACEAAAKVGGKVIGVDTDQSGLINEKYGADMTVTSAMKGLAATVNAVLTDIVFNDNWAAYSNQIATLGLVSGTELDKNYVSLPLETTQWADSFTQEDYAALVAALVDGTITVSGDTAEMPTTEVTVNTYADIKG